MEEVIKKESALIELEYSKTTEIAKQRMEEILLDPTKNFYEDYPYKPSTFDSQNFDENTL